LELRRTRLTRRLCASRFNACGVERQEGKTDETDGTDKNGFLFRLRRIRTSRRRVKVRSIRLVRSIRFAILSLLVAKRGEASKSAKRMNIVLVVRRGEINQELRKMSILLLSTPSYMQSKIRVNPLHPRPPCCYCVALV